MARFQVRKLFRSMTERPAASCAYDDGLDDDHEDGDDHQDEYQNDATDDRVSMLGEVPQDASRGLHRSRSKYLEASSNLTAQMQGFTLGDISQHSGRVGALSRRLRQFDSAPPGGWNGLMRDVSIPDSERHNSRGISYGISNGISNDLALSGAVRGAASARFVTPM